MIRAGGGRARMRIALTKGEEQMEAAIHREHPILHGELTWDCVLPSTKLECGWKLVGWSPCPLKHPHITPRRQRERHASVRPRSSEPWYSHLAPRTDSPWWSTDMICLLPLSSKTVNFLMFGAYSFFLGKSWEHPGNNKCVNYKGH